MGELPSIWRVELFHPLVIHFPIALLLSGTLAWLAGQFVDGEGTWGFLEPAGRLMLGAGVISAWIAVYTGDLANTEVARQLCDPTVVEAHEEYAFVVAGVFTGALALELASVLLDALEPWRRAITVVVGIALVAASGLLGYVGHLGATLVYQQAAGVYQPTESCTEFE
ncbi:MAG: DUF2231 domain-containing protein [Myxococcota bacterium]